MTEHPIIHVVLQDTQRRSLIINVKVSVKPGGSLRVRNSLTTLIELFVVNIAFCNHVIPIRSNI